MDLLYYSNESDTSIGLIAPRLLLELFTTVMGPTPALSYSAEAVVGPIYYSNGTDTSIVI